MSSRVIPKCPPNVESVPFVDENGDTIDIHIVGDGRRETTYFKAVDIAMLVGASRAQVITDALDVNNCVRIGKAINDPVYIKFAGLIQYIVSSRKARGTQYGIWIRKILFAFTINDHHTIVELAQPSLATVSPDLTISYPTGIYLLDVGTVGSLRNKLTEPTDAADDDVVLKFGMSNTNLFRRMQEHDFPNASRLVMCCMPPELAGKAEKEIHMYMNNMHIVKPFAYEKQSELVSVPRNKLDLITNSVRKIGVERGGENAKVNTTHEIEKINLHLNFSKEKLEKAEVDLQTIAKQLDAQLYDKDRQLSTLTTRIAEKERQLIEKD
ncbi:hypothetical protein SARC_06545 [Sphaeroforma arctica JP610]|uniref:Bro-N domain-containing protein n=1 Tax=Sphaeroforma arctica JP610 TaxID=667725 RepID=A0A0L0FWB9_9EUKA|nr:hypothetical protein SARC_06545 [Sphaeroforma arctica JP610]KNC81120.1 hypothetical protein SARC_06545 [Sphaeroforma arctica JP610]|eukprot:XP_014155022.1 hypothetical protein SARC_06545 [Sphaeroforma arctica JP610]